MKKELLNQLEKTKDGNTMKPTKNWNMTKVVSAVVSAIIFSTGSASAATVIGEVPFVIDRPGHYILTTDLVQEELPTPPDPDDPRWKVGAILIIADHVHLDLKGHSISGAGNISGNH